jgi:hypothetical protein
LTPKSFLVSLFVRVFLCCHVHLPHLTWSLLQIRGCAGPWFSCPGPRAGAHVRRSRISRIFSPNFCSKSPARLPVLVSARTVLLSCFDSFRVLIHLLHNRPDLVSGHSQSPRSMLLCVQEDSVCNPVAERFSRGLVGIISHSFACGSPRGVE